MSGRALTAAQPLRRIVLAATTGLLAASVVFVVVAALPSIGRALGITDIRTVQRVSPRHESAKQISRDAVDARSRELFLDDDDDGAAELAIVREKTSVYATPGKQRLSVLEPGTPVLIVGESASYYRIAVVGGPTKGSDRNKTGWIEKKSVRLR